MGADPAVRSNVRAVSSALTSVRQSIQFSGNQIPVNVATFWLGHIDRAIAVNESLLRRMVKEPTSDDLVIEVRRHVELVRYIIKSADREATLNFTPRLPRP